jgi:myosin-crossreactive antigen
MGDKFGNYVIQRLFECGNEDLRQKLYDTIVQPENLEEIKKTNFGTH